MFKRKPSRSREFRRNKKVIDITEERELRRKRRAEKRIEEEERQRLEKEKKLSNRQKKQRKNRRLVHFLATLLIVGLLAYSAIDIVSLRMQQKEVLKQNEELKKEKEEKENELKNAEDEEYVRQKARETLKLIMPGETLYVVPTEEKENNTDTTGEAIENSGDR